MGFLHEGHLALVDEARHRVDAVVMSVFVNPLQFGPHEDFERYPRDLPRDRRLAEKRGVDLLFVPSVPAMYPPGAEVTVLPGSAAERWEGAMRPGHFTGVLTVVAKLLHLVEPEVACFGQKDIQQVVLIRSMVRDLNWPVEILVVPTVRESDGVAMSSRNAYLSAEERTQARGLNLALRVAEAAWLQGETQPSVLERRMRDELAVFSGLIVEYIAVAEPDRMAPVERAEPGTILAVAARAGATRLIDNVILTY
jgi:pantoate--beta-alanine ligase